jgi:ribosome-binding protein aMBF1 (putative translation factor)
MTKINELHKKWAENPEYQSAYDELETEFELTRALIDARVAAGLTQAQVAERMETSQAAIARMEGGKVKPSAGSLERYAKAIGSRLHISFEPLNPI